MTTSGEKLMRRPTAVLDFLFETEQQKLTTVKNIFWMCILATLLFWPTSGTISTWRTLSIILGIAVMSFFMIILINLAVYFKAPRLLFILLGYLGFSFGSLCYTLYYIATAVEKEHQMKWFFNIFYVIPYILFMIVVVFDVITNGEMKNCTLTDAKKEQRRNDSLDRMGAVKKFVRRFLDLYNNNPPMTENLWYTIQIVLRLEVTLFLTLVGCIVTNDNWKVDLCSYLVVIVFCTSMVILINLAVYNQAPPQVLITILLGISGGFFGILCYGLYYLLTTKEINKVVIVQNAIRAITITVILYCIIKLLVYVKSNNTSKIKHSIVA